MPTPLTSASTRGNVRIRRVNASPSVTSSSTQRIPGCTGACGPAASSPRATTDAPASAKRHAVRAPMPDVPPVTTTVLPSNDQGRLMLDAPDGVKTARMPARRRNQDLDLRAIGEQRVEAVGDGIFERDRARDDRREIERARPDQPQQVF